MTPRQGPEINSPGLDDDNSEGTRRLTPFRLIQAHDRYWSDAGHVEALRAACRDDHEAVGEKASKVRADVIVHVLRVMAGYASFGDLTSNLTRQQLTERTLLTDRNVRDAFRVAINAGLITNVDKARKPIGNRPGRAPRRRLDYLEEALRDLDEKEPLNRAAATSSRTAMRPGLSTTVLHTTSESTREASRSASPIPNPWKKQFRLNLENEVKQQVRRLSLHAVRKQFNTKIHKAVDEAHAHFAEAGALPDDKDLVRYYADRAAKDQGNPNTWHMLKERYPTPQADIA